MEKRYLIKNTSFGTKENPNFAGKILVSFHGVGDKFIHANGMPYFWFIKELGYKRRCDAMRNWTYKNPENSKYWKSMVEIVEVEISV